MLRFIVAPLGNIQPLRSRVYSLGRVRMAPEDVSSLSYTWSSHKRERQNTLRVVFSNAAMREPRRRRRRNRSN